MPNSVVIRSPLNDRGAEVTEKGELLVTSNPQPQLPLVGTQNAYRFFTDFLRLDGVGSHQMNVTGTLLAPKKFSLVAAETYDIHVMKMIIVVADSAITHSDFGNVGVLPNGWDLSVIEYGIESVIVNKAKTGGQLIAQSGFSNPFNQAAETWELTNWTGNSDAMCASIPISEFIPGGFRLGAGTNDMILATVNDSLTGLDEFWVKLFGYTHLDTRGL